MIGTSIYSIYMNQIEINDNVTICGWIRSKRISKIGISFLNVYDGSIVYEMQIIAKNNLHNYQSEIIKLTIGCSIIVKGILKSSPGLLQSYEVHANNIIVLGKIKNPEVYPMSAKKHSLEYLRNFYHLRPRTNLIGSISRIRNVLFQSLHQFLTERGYIWVSTPIITSINAEGAGSMFHVSMLDVNNIYDKKYINSKKKSENFFNKKVFLTVSGQLTLEAYACSLSKVYSFGPIFRAENSNTKRHLSEFWMLEIEKAFSNLNEISILSEEILKYSVCNILDTCMPDLLLLQKLIDPNLIDRLKNFLEKNFIIISYHEAVQILLKNKIISKNVTFEEDLSTEHEKYLVEQYFECPVIIKNYPKSIKAFYMKVNKDKNTVAAIDVLLPIVGEIIGGSEREENLTILENRMHEIKLPSEYYDWYKDLRMYGTVPHAGFGLGFERLVMYVTGIKNVREAIPFPRTVGHANY